jgi:hypothetical protein
VGERGEKTRTESRRIEERVVGLASIDNRKNSIKRKRKEKKGKRMRNKTTEVWPKYKRSRQTEQANGASKRSKQGVLPRQLQTEEAGLHGRVVLSGIRLQPASTLWKRDTSFSAKDEEL